MTTYVKDRRKQNRKTRKKEKMEDEDKREGWKKRTERREK